MSGGPVLACGEAQVPSPLYAAVEGLPPLRIAVLLDGLASAPWVREALQEILEEGLGVFPLVLLENARPPARASMLFRAYRALDLRLHGARLPALRPVDLRQVLAGAEIIAADRAVAPGTTPDSKAPWCASSFDLDLVLDLGSGGLATQLRVSARHGTLSCGFGSALQREAEPALFRDLAIGGAPHATSVAVRDDAGVRECAHALRPESVWLSSHLGAAGSKARQCLVRSVRRLALDRSAGVRSVGGPAPSEAHGAADAPGNADMLRFALRSARTLFRKKRAQRTRETQWLLCYRRDASRFVANSRHADRTGFVNIEPPAGRMYADPFLFTHRGEDHLFFEDWDSRIGRASIGVMTFDRSGDPGPVRTALACDHHLSYPFLFEWDGDVYLLPESSEIGVLRLYRALRFPTEWEPHRDMLTGHEMADATLHAHEGRWYLFVNVSERGGSLKDDLFLFYADEPLGPWRPHPRNPVRSDIRCSRSAGRLFVRDGKLIRPAQDCSTSYGAAIELCEVEVLSENDYRERPVERIEPVWDPEFEGCHTLTFTDRLEVLDVRRTIPRLRSRSLSPSGR